MRVDSQAQDKEEVLDARNILDDVILFLESLGLIACFFYLLHIELNMFYCVAARRHS